MSDERPYVADLENSYAEGFTYTPFAADMKFVDPVVSLEGGAHSLFTPQLKPP